MDSWIKQKVAPGNANTKCMSHSLSSGDSEKSLGRLITILWTKVMASKNRLNSNKLFLGCNVLTDRKKEREREREKERKRERERGRERERKREKEREREGEIEREREREMALFLSGRLRLRLHCRYKYISFFSLKSSGVSDFRKA
jgi:hypothetical protein